MKDVVNGRRARGKPIVSCKLMSSRLVPSRKQTARHAQSTLKVRLTYAQVRIIVMDSYNEDLK